MIRRQVIVGLLHRVAYSLLAGLLTFVGALFPFDRYQGVVSFITHVLDFPVAVAGLFTSPYLAGIDLFFGRGVGEFMKPDEILRWHLQLAVPVYLVLFYAPTAVRALYRRWRGRRARAEKPEPVDEG
ncbi:MAG TPA: hypothetical protein PLN56_11975 [Methanoregulaceae archaeon]|nr:hypothetical protein [Methanoregulaceae archaeon]